MLSLAAALENGRVSSPYSRTGLLQVVPDGLVRAIRDELRELDAMGMAPEHVAHTLKLLSEERAAAQAISDRVALVWSGVEVTPGTSRDTAVVVQELFREARESVLIASYAVDSGGKAEALFGTLARRMDEDPRLRVRFFVNVHRSHHDETAASVLLREFAERFRDHIWPGERLPEVFHDPRSLTVDGNTRACLHAKCIVVDDDRALITSANFTEAAHERNIEAGAVIADPGLARALKAQFETLVDHGALKRIAGL